MEDDAEDVPGTGSQLDELRRLHQQKIRALLQANAQLKKEVKAAKKQGKESYRVKMIKAMRVQLREQGAIIETFKGKLVDMGASVEDLADWTEDCLNMPKLVRRPQPEVLEKQVNALQRENQKLQSKVAALQKKAKSLPRGSGTAGAAAGGGAGDGSALGGDGYSTSRTNTNADSGAGAGAGAGGGGGGVRKGPSYASFFSPRQQRRKTVPRDELMEQVEYLQTELAVKDQTVALQKDVVDRVQEQNRELMKYNHMFEAAEERRAQLAEDTQRLQTELVDSVAHSEQLYQEVRLLQGQVAQRTKQRDDLQQKTKRHALRREEDVTQALADKNRLVGELKVARTELHSANELVGLHKKRAEEIERRWMAETSDLRAQAIATDQDLQDARRLLAERDLQLQDFQKDIEKLRRHVRDLRARSKDADGSGQGEDTALSSKADQRKIRKMKKSYEQQLKTVKNQLSIKELEVRKLRVMHMEELRVAASGQGGGFSAALEKQLNELQAENKTLLEESSYQRSLSEHLRSTVVALQRYTLLMEKQMRSNGLEPPPRPKVSPLEQGGGGDGQDEDDDGNEDDDADQ